MNKTQELYQRLWNSADVLRSKMDANEYKSYLLGIIFYKFLSDKQLDFISEMLELDMDDLYDIQKIYEDIYQTKTGEMIKKELEYEFYYSIEPSLTFTALMQDVQEGTFQLEDLAEGFRNIEQSNLGFENLFEDIDLYSKKLGNTPQQQNDTISSVMKQIAPLNLSNYRGDVLGDAYEYLIGHFASESGKKAGEFYTPSQVSDLMARIAMDGRQDKKGLTVYDPTMGSGSLMLSPATYSNEKDTIRYFGQEINTSTYNLARMNLFLHGVPLENQTLNQGDTLNDDWPVDEPTNFDLVLMNPPYSAKWSAAKGFLEDPRFASVGVLPPKSRADMAFLLHGFYHLKQDGVMIIVLPHGPLFRGGAEEKIRKALLDRGVVDGIIGLPANAFVNTSIPTTLWVLKKDKADKSVFFIDASEEYKKEGNKNTLTEENVEKIHQAYLAREDVDKFAHLASFEEIQENDYNLNIPRYVDTFEPEPDIPLADVSDEILSTSKELEEAQADLKEMMAELEGTTPEADEALQSFMDALFNEGPGE